jgi:hypothetical protein
VKFRARRGDGDRFLGLSRSLSDVLRAIALLNDERPIAAPLIGKSPGRGFTEQGQCMPRSGRNRLCRSLRRGDGPQREAGCTQPETCCHCAVATHQSLLADETPVFAFWTNRREGRTLLASRAGPRTSGHKPLQNYSGPPARSSTAKSRNRGASQTHTAVVDEVVADKGYDSNQVLVDLAALDLRTYIAEPDRGRPKWTRKPAARDAVYANRRRIRGLRGRALQRHRSERLDRPNAHLYETGGMRRTHLRGHANILKRLFVHIGDFNLGLLMRTLVGVGTPRGLLGAAGGAHRPRYRAVDAGSSTLALTTGRHPPLTRLDSHRIIVSNGYPSACQGVLSPRAGSEAPPQTDESHMD